MNLSNIFHNIPDELKDELFQDIINTPAFRLERIVSRGHTTAPDFWYDQDKAEWVMLLSGEAVLLFKRDNRRIRMTPGDHILIPAHEKHRVEWTATDRDTVWLTLHFTDTKNQGDTT